jgi:hypothetical protein
MKTRIDCKHYLWGHCHNHVVVALFNSGMCPRCHVDQDGDASWCRFFEEGVPAIFSTKGSEYEVVK